MIQLSCNFKTNFQTLHHILSIDLVMSYCINRFIPFSFFFNILHSFCMVIVFFMQILHLILLIFMFSLKKIFLMTLQTMFINVICWLFCTFVFNTSVRKRHLVSCFLHAPLVDTTYCTSVHRVEWKALFAIFENEHFSADNIFMSPIWPRPQQSFYF